MLLWTPAYGQSKAGRPARTFIQQLCDDTGCNPGDLPKAMNDRETWRERVRDIRASHTSWWYMVFWKGLSDPFVSQNPREILASNFGGSDGWILFSSSIHSESLFSHPVVPCHIFLECQNFKSSLMSLAMDVIDLLGSLPMKACIPAANSAVLFYSVESEWVFQAAVLL